MNETIVFLIIMVVTALIVWKILKSLLIIKVLFRLISIVLLVFFAILLITGYSIIKDAKDFKERFSTSDNLFLLMDNNTIISGTELVNGSNGMVFKPLSQKNIEEMQKSYDTYEFNDMKTDYYKVFVFDTDSLNSIKEYNISELGVKIKNDAMKKLLNSDDIKEDAAKIIADEKDISYSEALDDINSLKEKNLKEFFFSAVVSEYFNPKNINNFLSGLKDSTISVYDETAMFKAVKVIPKFLMKTVVSKNNTIDALFDDTSTDTLV